jgi:hypothetical protein
MNGGLPPLFPQPHSLGFIPVPEASRNQNRRQTEPHSPVLFSKYVPRFYVGIVRKTYEKKQKKLSAA